MFTLNLLPAGPTGPSTVTCVSSCVCCPWSYFMQGFFCFTFVGTVRPYYHILLASSITVLLSMSPTSIMCQSCAVGSATKRPHWTRTLWSENSNFKSTWNMPSKMEVAPPPKLLSLFTRFTLLCLNIYYTVGWTKLFFYFYLNVLHARSPGQN